MNPSSVPAALLRAIKIAAALALAALGVAEIYHRSRSMVFFPDEIYNLDPILTFLRTADYTSVSQGGHPFDPVLSSGLLATWLNGAVFLGGGSLFTVRLATGLVHMVLASGLLTLMLRRRGLGFSDAVLFAVAVWVALIPVGAHELRIMNAGEVWGVLYLGLGVALAGRRPRLAALCWGLATWLVKIIYLPFAGLLLVGLAVAETRRGAHAGATLLGFVRKASVLGLVFLAPLFAWMTLIVVRYDLSTLVAWVNAYVTFVGKHAASVEVVGLDVPPGWHFAPQWNDAPLLSWGREVAVAYLGPLVLCAMVVFAYGNMRALGALGGSRRESALLAATVAGLLFAVVWFFNFDPTQWGRHLMPAIYVSVAVTVFCVASMWQVARKSQGASLIVGALVLSAMALVVHRSYEVTRAYADGNSWKLSYSRLCHGTRVLAPPCEQHDALKVVRMLTVEYCNTELDPFDPAEDCLWRERTRFLDQAIGVFANPDASSRELQTAGYRIVLLQSYVYFVEDEFLYDLAPHVCDGDEALRDRLREIGLDEAAMDASCRIDRDAPAPQAGPARGSGLPAPAPEGPTSKGPAPAPAPVSGS